MSKGIHLILGAALTLVAVTMMGAVSGYVSPFALGDLLTNTANYNNGGFKITSQAVGTTSGDGMAFGLNHLNDLATATGNYNMGGNGLTNLTTGFFRSLMVFSDSTGATTAGTNYFSVFTSHNSSEGSVNTRIPVAATLKNLYCTDTGPPGAGNSDTLTLRVNAVSSSVTCAISTGNTQCSDSSDSASITSGQTMTIQDVTAGTPGARAISCQFEVDL